MVIINFETNNIIVCENLLFSFKILLTLKFPAERVKVYNIMGSVRCVPFPLEKKREIKKMGRLLDATCLRLAFMKITEI